MNSLDPYVVYWIAETTLRGPYDDWFKPRAKCFADLKKATDFKMKLSTIAANFGSYQQCLVSKVTSTF
jgi:hypothetical protein